MFDLIEHVYDDTAQNLALEEVLLEPALKEEPRPTLRLWENPEISIVLGRGEKIEKQVNLERAKEKGIGVYRRVSGGGTVIHGPGNLNLSFILPYSMDKALVSIKQSYEFIHHWVCEAIEKQCGRRPEIRGGSDLVLGDKKISGTAQARKRFGLLHHMTLLIDFELEPYIDTLQQPERQPEYRENRSHTDFVTHLNREGLSLSQRSFKEAFESCFGSLKPRHLSSAEVAGVERLTFKKYTKDHWNMDGNLKP